MTNPPTITPSDDLANQLVNMFDVNQTADWQDAPSRHQALLAAARQVVVAMTPWLDEQLDTEPGS